MRSCFHPIWATVPVLALSTYFYLAHDAQAKTQLDPSPAKVFWLERSWPAGDIPMAAREKALAQLRLRSQVFRWDALATMAADTSLVWQSVGPRPIVDYFGEVTSGHIEAIALDPRNSDVVYAGASGGGVWKSLDGGINWKPLTDDQAALDISTIAIDPNRPDTVYAATGFYYQAPGLIKSTDGGASWKSLPIPETFPTSRRNAPISSVAVSPINSNLVLAAFGYNGNGASFMNGNAGVYRSLDGGESWSPVLLANSAHKVLFDPQNPNIAYAAVGFAFTANDPSGIYKSIDSGATWTAVGSSTLPTHGSSTIHKFQLAIAALRGSTLYASASDSQSLVGMYKSADGGQNWVRLSNVPEYCTVCIWSNVIAVHPSNPDIVFVAGNDILVRSMDGGLTWSMAKANYIHGDHHSLVFSPDGSLLYDGNDGGIYKTRDVTAPAVNWTSLNQNLQVTEFYQGVSAHPHDPTISFAGSQDNGLLRYAGGQQWTAEFFCDCFTTLVNTSDPTVVFGVALNSAPIQKSVDGGITFAAASNGLGSDLPRLPRVLAMDWQNPNVLYFGARRVYRSANAARNWIPISPDLANGTGQVTSIAVAVTDSNTIFAAASPDDVGSGGSEITSFQRSSLWYSGNAQSGATATWQLRSSGLPNRWISRVVVDPLDSNTAYLTLSGFDTNQASPSGSPGHVFKTSNAGFSWTNISANLPDVPLSDIVIDPDFPGTFYVASDIGVFVTRNGGQKWVLLGTGLPRAAVTGLLLHRSSRILRASTYGRGMWDLRIIGPSGLPAPIASAAGVVNGASFLPGTVAPGEIVTVFGSALSVDSLTGASIVGKKFATTVADTQVLFDDVPAPLVYVSSGQLAAIVPYAVYGHSWTRMQVRYKDLYSPGIRLGVAASVPALFSASSSGTGQGAILNEDNTANSPSNPAGPGSIVVLYGTGEGQTDPPGVDGLIASAKLAKPLLPVTVRIGGQNAQILYSGAAPGLVAGVIQINARIPNGVTGLSVPLQITVGGASSPPTITLAVAQ